MRCKFRFRYCELFFLSNGTPTQNGMSVREKGDTWVGDSKR